MSERVLEPIELAPLARPYEYHLPRDGRDVIGASIGPHRNGFSSSRHFDPVALRGAGYDSMRIIGHGNRIVPDLNGWADATMIFDGPFPVSLESATVHAHTKRAILVGLSSSGTNERRPVRNDLYDLRIVGREHDLLGGLWLIDSYQWTGLRQELELDAATMIGDGHAAYDRNPAWPGFRYLDCDVVGCWKEGLKAVGRVAAGGYPPGVDLMKHAHQGGPWPARAQLEYVGCHVGEHSLSGHGGAIIVQGPACDVLVEQCLLFQTRGAQALERAMLLGMNDGTTKGGFESWCYAEHVPFKHPANGTFEIMDTLLDAPAIPEGGFTKPLFLATDFTRLRIHGSRFRLAPGARTVIERNAPVWISETEGLDDVRIGDWSS